MKTHQVELAYIIDNKIKQITNTSKQILQDLRKMMREVQTAEDKKKFYGLL